MLKLISHITITQRPISTFKDRKLVFSFDFLNDLECSSTWQNLSDTGSLRIPKNLNFKTSDGKSVFFDSKYIGSSDGVNPPLILRGDKIKVELGYIYDLIDTEKTEMNTIFDGYITSVNPKMPIEITFEDNMWLLKQIQAPNKTFKTSQYTLETMLQELLKDTPYTVKTQLNGLPLVTKFGDFTTQNETIAMVLERLQKDFRFESFFVGTELRCGYIVYYPDTRKNHVFKFQHNIISDDLIYKRKDDVKIGVEIHTHQQVKGASRNKDGTFKTKKQKVDLFGYYDNNELKIIPVNEKPTAFDGEIRTINMMQMPYAQIKDYIAKQLNRLSYEGWRGTFTTFGLPRVNHGDIVQLIDDVIPERNGRYMVKGVNTSFGMNGFRQDVSLDIKVDDFTPAELLKGL